MEKLPKNLLIGAAAAIGVLVLRKLMSHNYEESPNYVNDSRTGEITEQKSIYSRTPSPLEL